MAWWPKAIGCTVARPGVIRISRSAILRHARRAGTTSTELPNLAISPLEIARLPLLTFSGRVSVISVAEEEERVKVAFENASLLGFDSESRPSTGLTPKNKTALIQVATEHVACLWRISDLKSMPPFLKSLLEDPGKIKVSQGASHEVDSLRQEWGLKPESFIDLHHIALYLRTTPRSLQGLVGIFLKKRLAKEQRLTDWERQTLTQAQIEYAAIDAWACRQVLVSMRSAYGVEQLECERLLGGPSPWRIREAGGTRTLESPPVVEHLVSNLGRSNLPSNAAPADAGDSQATQPSLAQAHQQLAALCVARGYALRFDGFEPAASGGFRCAFRVEYRQRGTMVSNIFRSKRVHSTIRMAQNDAASEALAGLQRAESPECSGDAASSSSSAM